MVFWGLVLIAIGVGALLGISLWPLILIALGTTLLVSAIFGRRGRHRHWLWWSWWHDRERWREFQRCHEEERGTERTHD